MALLKRIILLLILLILIPAVDASVWINQSVADTLTAENVTEGQTIQVPNNGSVILSRISLAIFNFGSSQTTTLNIYTSPAKTTLIHSYPVTVPAPNAGSTYDLSTIIDTFLPLTQNASYYLELTNPSPNNNFAWWRDALGTDPYPNGSAYGNGALMSTDRTFWINFINSTPFLTYPANGSSINTTYPPLTTNITFTWESSDSIASNILIAKDANFNVIEVDSTTSNNYTIQALEAGTHYWKVRYYNATSGTYYNYSNYSYFTLTSTSITTGTAGIQGIVYEFIGTTKTPVSGATVYLYNNTYTASTLTGSNGYYLFSPLANNSTYSVYASKQGYDTTATLPATTGAGSITTNDILMKIFISPFIPNFIFEKFSVRSYFDRPYPGVSVNIFKNGDVIASFSGTTDSMGQVTFQLIKDTYYRAEFSGGGLPNTIIVYFYGKEEEYLVNVLTGFPTTGDLQHDINATLTVFPFNSTFSNLSLVYLDNRSSTTIINFYAINLTTNATCLVTNVSQNTTLNCTVLAAGTYRFGFNATSSIYGLFQQDKIINFGAGNTSTPQLGLSGKVSSALLHWTSVIILIFLAAFFSIKTVKYGAVVLPSVALVMWWVGTLQVNFILLSIALVLGIMVYLRTSEVKTVY